MPVVGVAGRENTATVAARPFTAWRLIYIYATVTGWLQRLDTYVRLTTTVPHTRLPRTPTFTITF